jgi:putative cell wall-binding protein
VCADVLSAITAAVPGVGIARFSGEDRYATAVEGSKSGWTSAPVVYLANGESFPDGLSAGPLAALNGAPLLLVPGCSVPAAVDAEIARLKPAKVVAIGGPGAVCEEVLSTLSS